MKHIKFLLMLPFMVLCAFVDSYCRRTICLYDIEPHDIKGLHQTMEKAFGAMKEKIDEHATRLLEIEQKGERSRSGSLNDENGIAQSFKSSEGFRALLNNESKNARFAIPAKSLERKNIYSSITGGSIAPADFSNEIIAPSARKLMVRDLLPSVPTNAGSTEFVRETSFTNNAGPQGGNSSPTVAGGEGEVKNASDMTFELITSPVITIAHHFTVSRQALDDSAALAQHVETRGIWGWQYELDEELLIGDGTAGVLDGLVNNATEFTGGATNQSPLDTIRKAITQLALANNYATGLVLNPSDAETLELVKDTTGQYLKAVVYANGVPQVWRVPIIETNAMTAGQFLLGDFQMAARIRDRQEAHVEISLDHADYRTRNLALILIEGRVGLEIFRPSALVTGSLENVG